MKSKYVFRFNEGVGDWECDTLPGVGLCKEEFGSVFNLFDDSIDRAVLLVSAVKPVGVNGWIHMKFNHHQKTYKATYDVAMIPRDGDLTSNAIEGLATANIPREIWCFCEQQFSGTEEVYA